MKKVFILFVCLWIMGCSTKERPFKIYGNTVYEKNKEEALNSKLNAEYKFHIKQIKAYPTYLTGRVTTDYNHFNGETKHNVFTTLGFEF